jgi:hypothetical protein
MSELTYLLPLSREMIYVNFSSKFSYTTNFTSTSMICLTTSSKSYIEQKGVLFTKGEKEINERSGRKERGLK